MIVLIIASFLSWGIFADSMISCNDGDTCRFNKNGRIMKVRLSGIDAPESDQPFGTESRDFLIKLLKGKTVRLVCNGKSFDRETCEIYLGEIDIQSELVKNGYAVDSPKFSKGKYKKDQELAQSKKIGIWSANEMVSPYCWRWVGTKECNKDKLYQPIE